MITVVGEALVDLTPVDCGGEPGFVPRPGGSPFNVAVGAARLGAPTGFVGRVSTDAFGAQLVGRLTGEEVGTSRVVRTDDPTTLAVVQLDAEGRATYGFYREGTSAFGLDAASVERIPEDTTVVHVSCGAVSLEDEPAGAALRAALTPRAGRITSFDPNVRPAFIADRDRYVDVVERTVAGCSLVKVSDEDLGWLYPGEPAEAVAGRWRGSGPGLVVVTRGDRGAVALGVARVDVAGWDVDVVDTVGAGDSFTAALLTWLHERGVTDVEALSALDDGALTKALRFSVAAAAMTCTRRGAEPPRRGEL